MVSDSILENKLAEFCKNGVLVPRTENNKYLKVSYKGAGNLVSDKWNVKIYSSGAIVCNDIKTLNDLRNDSLSSPNTSLKLIQIDDAGGGFPLCGVMVGVCVDQNTLITGVVDVKFFQSPLWEKHEYLNEYASKGIEIINRIKASPKTHRIEICSGHVNTNLKDKLRVLGYDVRVTDIKGRLQDDLETTFKQYVDKMTGENLAYDPKLYQTKDLGKPYFRALNWGIRFRQDLLKSGWDSIKIRLN